MLFESVWLLDCDLSMPPELNRPPFEKWFKDQIPPFSGNYKPITISSYSSLFARFDRWTNDYNTEYLEYEKVRLKFKWRSQVKAKDRHPVKYFVLLIPSGPNHYLTFESYPSRLHEKAKLHSTITWDGQASESPVYTIAPWGGTRGDYKIIKVDLDIDASDSRATKLNYTLPDSVPVNRATLWYGSDDLGWTKWDEKTALTGSDFLTFNQNYIDLIRFDGVPDTVDQDLKLELEIAGQSLEFRVKADQMERMKTATELITGFWINVGTRIFNHTISERYYDMVYSVPASGELRKLSSTFASVNLGSSDFSAGTESHKYNPDGGDKKNMTFNRNTIGRNPNLVSWSLSSHLWIDTSATTVNEGICTNSGINVFTRLGPALGRSTNKSVDVTID